MIKIKGVNINDRDAPYTNMILDGTKTIETRKTNSLKSLVGQRVGIIRTGVGKAVIIGYVDITGVIKYETETEFRLDFDKHKVKAGSKYDIKPNEIKYGYILKNPKRCEPKIAPKGGRVIRKNIE